MFSCFLGSSWESFIEGISIPFSTNSEVSIDINMAMLCYNRSNLTLGSFSLNLHDAPLSLLILYVSLALEETLFLFFCNQYGYFLYKSHQVYSILGYDTI
jgi:hypothetical protein